MVGIPVNKTIDLDQLQAELVAAGITVPSLGMGAGTVFTYNAAGNPIDPPAGTAAVVTAHTPSTALRDQFVSRLQATVGVALPDLTNAQLLLLVGALLYKIGGINRQGQIRPLNLWLV